MNNASHICPRCGDAQPVSAFYSDKSKSNGRRFICKSCGLERSRAYYRANREEKLAKVKAYQARVRDKRTPTPKVGARVRVVV
jgi:transcription elongation factor Elf1